MFGKVGAPFNNGNAIKPIREVMKMRCFRTTDSQWDWIQQEADRLDISTSEFIRRRVLKNHIAAYEEVDADGVRYCIVNEV